MDTQYVPQQPPQQTELADPDEMQHMWQFLDSTLTTGSTPNGLPSQASNTSGSGDGAPAMMHAQYGPPGGSSAGSVATHPGVHASPMMQQQQQHPTGTTAQFLQQQQQQINDAMRESTLNEDENGMYNELGDVFSMFFNIDSDEPQQHHLGGGSGANAAAIAHAYAQHMSNAHTGSFVGAPRYQHNSSGESDSIQKVQLARSASASSSHSGMDSISPGGLLGYPSMSPATINWLQSLAKSESSESLSGMISPATINITPGALSGSASANSLTDGADSLERYVMYDLWVFCYRDRSCCFCCM